MNYNILLKSFIYSMLYAFVIESYNKSLKILEFDLLYFMKVGLIFFAVTIVLNLLFEKKKKDK
jgi:hypothetical protein